MEKKGGIECHTMQLMKLNSRLSDTSNEIIARSDAIIQDLIVLLRESAAQLFRLCESVGLLDMVTSFAHLSILRDYVRPEFRGTFALKAARHPIMDKVCILSDTDTTSGWCNRKEIVKLTGEADIIRGIRAE